MTPIISVPFRREGGVACYTTIEHEQAAIGISSSKDLLRIPALQGPVELDNNELIVVRLPAADMTADTEWEVVIVQNADVFRVKEEDVLNRHERKGEVPVDADITGLSRLGDA